MSDIINFYETEAVKKYLPNQNDPQKEYTGMNIDTRILLCGASGSGKSNALMNYLVLTSKPPKGTFKHIFLISKVKEPLYETLEEKLKDKISIYKSVAELPSVQDFKDMNKDKPEHFLVILDDCVTDKDKASVKKIEEYYAYSRKKGITTIYLSQSYFQTPKFCRDNCNYIILVSIKSVKDLDRIIREYAMPDIELPQIQKMFKYATQQPLNFLKITSGTCPASKRFSRNFLHYLNPEEFKDNKKLKEGISSDSDSDDSLHTIPESYQKPKTKPIPIPKKPKTVVGIGIYKSHITDLKNKMKNSSFWGNK